MAKLATITIQLDEEKLDRLKAIAVLEQRPISSIIEEAIDDRLAYEDEWVREVQNAIERDGLLFAKKEGEH